MLLYTVPLVHPAGVVKTFAFASAMAASNFASAVSRTCLRFLYATKRRFVESVTM
jgi:hypothetical protein